MQADEYDKALGLLDEWAALDPNMGSQVQMMKLSVLLEKKDYKAVNEAAAKLVDGALKDKPQEQGQLALMMLRSEGAEHVDTDLTLKMAERALAAAPDELRFQKAAALAYAAKKQYAKAAEIQAKLVEKLKGRGGAEEATLLEEYKGKAAEPK